MQRTPGQSERQHTCLPTSSTRTYQTSLSPCSTTPKTKKEILCKIAFEIDNDEQELLIYDNVNLDMVTDELIMKLNFASLMRNEPEIEISQEQRAVLQQQIKAKIQVIIESCIDNSPKAIRWKNKLTEFISNKSGSLEKPQKDLQIFKSLGAANETRGVSYFGYNTVKTDSGQLQSGSNLRNLEIIQRGKQIQHSLSKCSLKGQQGQETSHRLYELGRRNDAIKQYLSKIRQQYVQQEQLNECTFHPNLAKLHLKTQQTTHSRFRDQSQNVFDRLYKQALQKQQKIKIIEKEVQEKQQEQYRHLKFIPSINSCSRDIVSAKKEARKNNTISVYQQLYGEVFKKEKPQINNNFIFRPTLCPKSEQLAKKAKNNKSARHLLFRQQIQKETDNSSYQSQAQTKRSTSKRGLTRKSKQKQLFLKDFEHLYRFEHQSTASANKVKQLKNIKTNGSKSKENDINSGHSSLKKRAQTSQTQTIRPSKVTPKIYKNVIDISAFGSQVQNQGNYFKKTKENLFFLPQTTVQSQSQLRQHQTLNNILTERINGYGLKQNIPSKTIDHQLKAKKGMLDPYEFFKQEELKKGTRSNRAKTESTSVAEMAKQAEAHSPINKQKIFEGIFEALNYRRGQQIDAQCIYHSRIIPGELSNVFLPMAEQMKQLNVGLDKQEFVWSLSRIYDSLNQNQRQSMQVWSRTLKLSRQIQSCHNELFDMNN